MPIVYDIDQGSPEWNLIRLGIPTASNFSRLLTGANRQFSAGANKYAREKVAEMITGMSQGGDYVSDDMLMGQITEQEAADSYEYMNDVKTEKVGFVTDDLGHYGASPDRLVGKFGLVEIKRKNPTDMIDWLLKQKIDPAHIAQIQGTLFVTGRLWCDWHLYHPDMPRLTIRTWRNERYIDDIRRDLVAFRKLVFGQLRQLAEFGYIDLDEMAQRALEARKGIVGRKITAPCETKEGIKLLKANSK